MLASINVNLNVYIEPNEITWDIIKKYYSWRDPIELEKFMEEFKRNTMKSVNVRGKTLQVIEFQIWDFMHMFGKYMSLGNTDGPHFNNNQVYFDLDDLCPIFDKDQIPTLPEPTRFQLSPKSTLTIPTKFANGDTVRVKFDDEDDGIFAYWADPEFIDTVQLKEEIVDDEQDYIIMEGRNAIVLSNSTDKPVHCSISFAAYKTGK